MAIISLDHVQVAIPTGGEQQARDFYCGVLGFKEIDKPKEMAGRDSIWLVSGSVNLHLGVEPQFHPAHRAHPAMVVEGMDRLLAACESAGAPVKPDTAFQGFRRVHVLDPFGNRLEFMGKVRE